MWSSQEIVAHITIVNFSGKEKRPGENPDVFYNHK